MKVETIPINKIIPYARNPRHNDGLPVAKVKASLLEFGWQQPIVVDENFVILAGHTRYKAALELGMEAVPVHIADNLTATQAKAYRLADNKTGEFAAWDTELLKLEFDDLTIAGFDLDLTGFSADDYGVPDDGDTDSEEDRSDEPRKTMAERFGVPPFSVLSARDGWWQSRKQAWIALGLKSELGRGATEEGGRSDMAEASQGYKLLQKASAIPGGSLMPAMDYSRRQRGDGHGRPL